MILDAEPCVGVFHDPLLRRESEYFQGVARFAETRDWRLIVGEKILSLPRSALNHWPGHGVLGFLRNKTFTDALRRAHIPAVNSAQVGMGWGISSVVPDFVGAGRLAAQYFLERGFRNFAYCVEPQYAYRDTKLKGFSERLAEAGLTCFLVSQPLSLPGKRTWAQHRTILIGLLRQLPKPVAIWARQDQFAARVVSACEAGQIAVPSEVAVMGYGNEKSLCPYTTPPLASIEMDYEDIGFRAAETLQRLMEGDTKIPETVYISPQSVVERGSADSIAQIDPELAKALTYIEHHACDPAWVEDVLKHMGINRRRLERLFRQHLHRSPHTEIVRVRMRRARDLLAESDLSLSEVAATCGFADYTSLRRAFKRFGGLTPRAYRKRPPGA